MNKKITLLLSVLFFHHEVIITQAQTTIDHSITIFVHGTYPARKLLQRTVCKKLMYCPQGLSLAKNLPKNYHFYKMAQGCVDLNNSMYSFDQFYIFGWKSEKVYDSVRIEAAKDLVQGIKKLVATYYDEYKIIPKIRLVGFSHGGNVVLHTANYLPLKINKTQVDIEAWIFGTPVQQINHHLINSRCFSRIYSIFSKKDWLQRMDPQGLRDKKIRKKHFWSDRQFKDDSECLQVDFKVNNKSISHSYYRYIFKYFPMIQKMIQDASEGKTTGLIAVNLKI